MAMAEFFDSLSGLSAAATEAASSLASAPLAAAIDSLSPDDADNIFDALDADGDGKLTLDELQSYLMARDSWCNAEDAANLFASLDADKDGVVSREELRAGLKRHAAEKPLLAWLMALRPPPAGLAVFREVVEVQAAATREEEARGEATEESTPNETDCDDCRYWKTVREPFVRPGGAVDIAEAAERAMTLWQLKTVKEHTHRRCRDEAWIGKRFAGGRMRFDLLQPQDVNLYDVASQVILPATFGHVLADGETKPSFVELVADGPQPPDYFVHRRIPLEPSDDLRSLSRALKGQRSRVPRAAGVALVGRAHRGLCRVHCAAHDGSHVRRLPSAVAAVGRLHD